jgi:hypothetical protein
VTKSEQISIDPILEAARSLVSLELKDIPPDRGDFVAVAGEVEAQNLGAMRRDGLSEPVIDKTVYGQWKVDLPKFFNSTTSTATPVYRVNNQGGREYVVVKTLREPWYRVSEDLNGRPFSDTAGHFLFPWDDPQHGIWYQLACLRGEMRAGVWHNKEKHPYKGLVGIQARPGGVMLHPVGDVSAEKKIWPALVMELKETQFNVAQVLVDWVNGGWDELDQDDIVYLLSEAVMLYDRSAIPASDQLKQLFGSKEFFRRCLVGETPRDAALMGSWAGADEVVKKAASYAQEITKISDLIISDYSELFIYIPLVIGHADSKFSNTIIEASSHAELIRAIKSRQISLLALDAQHLAVKPGVFRKYENGKWIGIDGINYAHWRIVPQMQQWAYALMQLMGMGLEDLHNQVLEEVLKQSQYEHLWDNGMQAAYWLQAAYKMGGVEPLVHAHNWLASTQTNRETKYLLEMTMKKYPQAAAESARRAARLVEIPGYSPRWRFEL